VFGCAGPSSGITVYDVSGNNLKLLSAYTCKAADLDLKSLLYRVQEFS
jgi:hypothetical protein